MNHDGNFKKLEERAKILRLKTLDLVTKEGDPHLASSLSTMDILTALYENILSCNDKFILSKGHACFGFYTLLREKEYNPVLSGHPDVDEKNGIYATTGSLGHGLPIAAGIAYAKKKKNCNGNVYVLIGDGECQEGSVWEAISFAADYKLNNLITIVDHNKLQALDKIANISPSSINLEKKFNAFGCEVVEIDGHDFNQLIPALSPTKSLFPKVIIANTIKGKGISFMENDPKWQTRKLNLEELKQAHYELEK